MILQNPVAGADVIGLHELHLHVRLQFIHSGQCEVAKKKYDNSKAIQFSRARIG